MVGLLAQHRVVLVVALTALLALVTVTQWYWTTPPSERSLQQDHLPSINTDAIHIALACDKDYYVGMLALLNSTSLNCRTPSALHFHLVTTDEPSKQFLESRVRAVFPDLSVDVVVLNAATGHELPASTVWAQYRSAALSKPIVYARYLFPDCFPSLRRVLYLDQDVLVVGDIGELWRVDMQGFPIAAVRLSRPGAEFHKQLNMNDPALRHYNEHESSMNNGVLLYDLDAWRRPGANYTQQLLAWTALNRQRQLYLLGSQPPFNLVFYNNYKVLDRKWNVMDLAGLARPDTGEPITVPYTDIVEAGILHWNGVLKPWACQGHYSELWRSYLPNYQLYLPVSLSSSPRDACPAQVVWTEGMRLRTGQEQFTVVLTSFMREDNLLRIVQHLRKSDYIKEVLLVWNRANASCPINIAPLVRCFPQSHNFVHNRFSPWPNITTDAVLQYDDDVLAPLIDLENAFKLWTLHRDRMLGFEPRVVRCEDPTDSVTCTYGFQLQDGLFDLVIGKLFFVRNSYMRDFLRYPGMLPLISSAPCEDLAMNFYIGRVAKQPPLLYQSNITEIQSQLFHGLSQRIDTEVWRYLRSRCVARLLELFNGKPVQPQSTYYHLDSQQQFVLQSSLYVNFSWCSDVHGSRVCRQP